MRYRRVTPRARTPGCAAFTAVWITLGLVGLGRVADVMAEDYVLDLISDRRGRRSKRRALWAWAVAPSLRSGEASTVGVGGRPGFERDSRSRRPPPAARRDQAA